MKHRRTVVSMIAVVLLSAVAASAQTYTKLYTYPIGSGAYSGIMIPQVMSQGRDGNLYSTIQNDGTKNVGTVYSMTTTGTLSTVYSFCALTSCTDGSYPWGGVTLGFDGNFYGTTQGGGTHAAGTVFKVTPTGTLTTLWNFANGTDDSVPVYTTALGQDGNMYGVSVGQYNTQYGAFFKVSAAGVFKALRDFGYTNGADPNLPTQSTDGNFYGTTQLGGDPTCKCGVIYKATPAGAITVLHAFKGGSTDGNHPYGILVQGTDGNFYGTTYGVRFISGGTIFKVSPSGAYKQIHAFAGGATDGVLPTAGLTLGPDGNFYGTTTGGGAHNYGTIYKLNPSTGAVTVVYSFDSQPGGADGIGPTTPLVLHTNGKLYGNTAGSSLGGSVFYSLDMGFKPLVDLVTWSAKVGKTVEILGQGFTGTTKVSFNGVSAPFTNVSDTYMTATVPAGATTGAVTVTTFTSTLKSNRSFLVVPQITSFSPTSGIVGTSVTITGVSLTQATKVTIGGNAATFTVKSDTQVTATVPVGAKTGLPIAITTAGGIASFGKFTVVPSITSFNPTSGPVGTSVTITGNSFSKATSVTFGGVAATSFQVISDTQVDALVPTGAVTGPIAVTTAGGTGTSATNFTVTP
jgi:uncharacterized repeat protein (TIGR03803 family)